MDEKYRKTMQKEDHPHQFPRMIFINPKIRPTDESREVVYFESCLSIPHYSALVSRHSTIEVEALDGKGQEQNVVLTGWPARILQHE